MNGNQKKLIVNIEARVDEKLTPFAQKLDKIASSLEKLSSSFGGLDLLTSKLGKLSEALNVQNGLKAVALQTKQTADATKKATSETNKQIIAVNKETAARKAQAEVLAKSYERLGNLKEAASLRIGQLNKSDPNYKAAKANIVAPLIKKTNNSQDALSLLSLVGSGQIRKSLFTALVKPLEDAEKAAVKLANSNAFRQANNRVRETFFDGTNSFANLRDKINSKDRVGTQKDYNTLFESIKPPSTSQWKALGKSLSDGAKGFNKELEDLERFIDSKRRKAVNLSVYDRINSVNAINSYKPIGANVASPQSARNVFSSNNMKMNYGFDTNKYDQNPKILQSFQRTAQKIKQSAASIGSIPSARSMKASVSFSELLYNKYSKLGEVLFRIQYATLTLAQLGGLTIFAQASDQFMNIESSVARVVKDQDQFNVAMRETRKIARDTYMSYEAVAGIYTKLGMEAAKYNLSQEQTLKLTKTISVLAAAGGKNQATDQALYQFQQSISSGKFGGDELRSVFEGAPLLAKALAAGTQGTSLADADISKLRPEKGGPNVKTADLIKGLQSDVVQTEVAKLERTIRGTFAGAMTNLWTTVVTASGKLNQATGAASGLNKFSKFVDQLVFSDTTKDKQVELDLVGGNNKIGSEERAALQNEIIQRYKNIDATRELIKQMTLLAASFVAVKLASTAVQAGRIGLLGGVGANGPTRGLLGGVGKSFSKGVATADAFSSLGNSINGVTGKANKLTQGILGTGFAITTLIKNFVSMFGKTLLLGGAVIVISGIFQGLTRGTKYAGKELNLMVGYIILFGKAVANIAVGIGKIIGDMINQVAEWTRGFRESMRKTEYSSQDKALRSMEEADARGELTSDDKELLRGLRETIANRDKGGFEFGSVRFNNQTALTAFDGMFGNKARPPEFGSMYSENSGNTPNSGDSKAVNAPSPAAEKAAQNMQKMAEIYRSAEKYIQDIVDNTEKINRSGLNGSFFEEEANRTEEGLNGLGDILERGNKLSRQLNARLADLRAARANAGDAKDRAALDRQIDAAVNSAVGVLPAAQRTLFEKLKKALDQERNANRNKRLRELDSDFNLSIFDRDLALANRDRGSLSADLNSGLGDLLKKQIEFVNEDLRPAYESLLSQSGQDPFSFISKSYASIQENFRPQFERGIRDVFASIVEQARKAFDELNKVNNKANSDSLYTYNQSARGVFGRNADKENERRELDNSYRDELVKNFSFSSREDAGSRSVTQLIREAESNLKATRENINAEISKGRLLTQITPQENSSTSNPTSGQREAELVTVTASRKIDILKSLEENYNKAVEDLSKRQELLERLLASPWVGAQRAIQTYLDSIKDVASQTENLVGNALKGLEDKLVEFVQTGKFNFRDLAQSILADLTRMFVKASIMKPITEFLQKKTGLFGEAPKQEDSNFFKSMTVTAAQVIVNGNLLGSSPVNDTLGIFGSNSKIAPTNYPTLDPITAIVEDPAKTQTIIDQMLNPIKSIMSGFTGGFGGIIQSALSIFQNILGSLSGAGGGGTGSAGGIMSLIKLGASFFGVPVFHNGGLASRPTEMRNVDMSSVMGLPKYHSGKLGSNELFAILKNDEIVLNKDQQSRLGKTMSNRGGNSLAIPTQINLTYNAAEGGNDTKEAENMSKMMTQAVDRQVREILLKEKMQGGMLR